MHLNHSRGFLSAAAVAALALAAPAAAAQADRRATNATQKAQTTSQPERREATRPDARSTTPDTREAPQARARTRPDEPPAGGGSGNGASGRGGSGYAVARPPAPPHPPERPPVVVVKPNYRPPRPVHPHRQPYFVFTPRVTLSFGLVIGHPVAYPVFYQPRPVYGYPVVTHSRVGGVSFDIDPWDTAVFVDGVYVGIADDFSCYEPPLTLRAGVHRIELRARGYYPMVFDLTVVPGQVIPYRGALAPGPRW